MFLFELSVEREIWKTGGNGTLAELLQLASLEGLQIRALATAATRLATERRVEERERKGASERALAGRQGRYDVADYRPGLRFGSTRAPASGKPSYRPRGPSCRRRGVLRNVGAATVGPAVPLTIPFSLCPPFRRERCSYVSAGCHLVAHIHAYIRTRARAHTHTHTYHSISDSFLS